MELKKGIENLSVQAHGVSVGAIRVSVGVAGFPDHGLTWADVLKSCDRALYQAKNEGRNRVAVAAEGVERQSDSS